MRYPAVAYWECGAYDWSYIVKLLDEIIESVTAQQEPISQTLRRTLVLAYRLQNDGLKSWIESELNGYANREALPDYRKGTGTAKGLFLGPLGAALQNQPIPSGILEQQHRFWATDIALTQPIASYDNRDDDRTAIIQWPQDLVVYYQSKFYRGYALNRAWMEIPGSMIAGLVDTVRTRLLTFALEIQSQLPDDTEKAVEQIEPATVDKLVAIHIYGGNVQFGDGGVINAHTIITGNMESLEKALKAIGVDNDEFNELQKSIELDAAEASEGGRPKSLGARTLAWIGKTSVKVAKSGLKIGADAATTVLTEWIKKQAGIG
jgi:hypothetical protein